jgi:hypothetical protein
MTLRTVLLRLLAGAGVLALLLIALFAMTLSAIPRWGATLEEVVRPLPGDGLAPRPLLNWTNAIDVDAPPGEVWPWIAQMGDTRGGFYSYTFIEDRVGPLMGDGSYTVDYENADTLVSAWQHPAPGDMLIQGILKVREVRPGDYLLADSLRPETMQWTWLWKLVPLDGGERTRLIVRFHIQLPGEDGSPLFTGLMTAGGFVMQQRMMHGLKIRAEGGAEPDGIEVVEIVLWLATLAAGLIAASLFLLRRDWRAPLALAVASVTALVTLTFIQPEIGVRILVNTLLLLWVWRASHPATQPVPRAAAGRLSREAR